MIMYSHLYQMADLSIALAILIGFLIINNVVYQREKWQHVYKI